MFPGSGREHRTGSMQIQERASSLTVITGIIFHVYVFCFVNEGWLALKQIRDCVSAISLVHVKQVSCSATHFLVALLTAAGANGLPGQTAPPSVEAGLRCGRVSVITPPLRAAAESVRAPADSRTCVTLTPAQVRQRDGCHLSHKLFWKSVFSMMDNCSCRFWPLVRLVSVVSVHRQLWWRVSEP